MNTKPTKIKSKEKREAFWSTTRELFKYRRLLLLALSGALISAICFGAGIGMLLPVFALFFDSGQLASGEHPMHRIIDETFLRSADPSAWQMHTATWLKTSIPDSLFACFAIVMVIIAILTIIGSIGRYMHQYMVITVTRREAAAWRDRLFAKMIYAPMEYFWGGRAAADHASRIMVDTNMLARGHQAILGKAVADVLKGFAGVGMAFYFDWRLTLLALISAPIIAVLMRKFGKIVNRASKKALTEQGNMFKTLTSVLSGLMLVKTYDAEGYERRHFRRQNRRLFHQQMKMRQAKALASPVVETIGLVGVQLAGLVAAWFVFNHGIEPQSVLLVLFALGAAGASLRPLANLHVEIKEAGAAATRILEAYDIEPEAIEFKVRSKMPALPQHRVGIDFEQVTYTYPRNDEPALRDINLHIPFGSYVAVVGQNGSGKSTLLSMIPRLIDPTLGCVRVDGIDLSSINLRSLREQIAIVSQQSVLFEGTIAENIAYGCSYILREKIEEAGRAAFVDEFVTNLPQGYDTPLGEAGSGLSGGQRQRICIARAILRDPRIFILDEATSQIDADSEMRIHEAMIRFRKGRTVLAIAHRLSTVIDADKILVMHQGQIIDSGTHQELLEQCEIYRMLTKTQLQQSPSS